MMLIILVAIIFLVLFFFSRNKKTEIELKGQKFQIEISRSEKEREQGLSGRNNLCENCGMLFVFPQEEKQGFWMKKMNFDLDIIWINNKKIVYIAKNVSHNLKETIIPEVKANRVLELSAGTTDNFGIEIGDEIEFR